ncbi:hypothetical protein [Thiolapillus sp.]|uniref:hypothetical protein n=2 Tax=Thiolapillus sp. TaxID=2017437 RepID=UPI0025D2BA2D|nr:hypothetical protein [Thiolapillus sp.]
MKTLTSIQGGADRKFKALLEHPETFGTKEFLSLCERYAHRLPYEDQLALGRLRLQRQRDKSLDANALLAVLDGRYDDAHRLSAIMQRRNALGIRSVSRDKAPE